VGIVGFVRTICIGVLVFLSLSAGAQCADTSYAVFIPVNKPVICKGESNGSFTVRINPIDNSSVSYVVFFEGGPPVIADPSMDVPGTFESTFSGLAVGSYEVVVRDNNNCYDTLNVDIQEPAEAFTVLIDSTSDATCFDNGYIAATTTGGWSSPTVYTWTAFDDMMNILPGYPRTLGFSLSGLQGGAYTVEATDFRGCTASASTSLVGFPEFEISILPPGNQVSDLGEAIELNVTASSGTNISYQWFPLTYLEILSPLGDTVRSTPCSEVIYIVLGIDEDRQCSDADSVLVSLTGEFDPFIPNIFNPNSFDPRNNEFQVFGAGIQDVDMEIFDRKGALIYESSDSTLARWNGLIGGDGLEAVAGKYIYNIRVRSICGEVLGRSGGVTLIR
jgi:hypothetical protein